LAEAAPVRTLIQCRRNLSTSRWATPPPSASAPSLGGGYPDRLVGKLRAAYPALKLLNLGQSGATSSDVLESQVPARSAPGAADHARDRDRRRARSCSHRTVSTTSALGYDVWAERMLAPAVALLRESIGASA